MSEHQPEIAPTNKGETFLDFAEADEFSELAESLSNFDEARTSVYAQTEAIMQGLGGESKQKAIELLAKLTKHAAQIYSDLFMTIMEEYAYDSNHGLQFMTDIYLNDEAERLDLARRLYPEGKYKDQSFDIVFDGFGHILAAEMTKEDTASTIKDSYGQSVVIDINECIEASPPNKLEVATVESSKRRELVKTVALEAGKIVAGGLIAGIVAAKFRK